MTRAVLRRVVVWSALAVALSGAAVVLAIPRAGAQATETEPIVTSTAQTTIVINGRGWGHGVGMGQWGMFGFAKRGWAYNRILAHYYRGTTLERRGSPNVRVLLVEGASRVTLESGAPWSVVDDKGKKVKLRAGRLTVTSKLVVSGKKLRGPLTFSPGREPLAVDGKPYRGQMVVSAGRGRLQVVNALSLEAYLLGVVPQEVSFYWPLEALKAQAVAARSYALSELAGQSEEPRAFDLYSDTRSQAYGGIDEEKPPTSKAVRATSRQVLLYRGKVARTYYSSTTGGRTLSAREWSGSPVPYLVSVRDPYDSLSPYHTWGPVVFDAKTVARALGVKGTLRDLELTLGPSGRVQTVTAVGSGSRAEVRGTDVRVALDLRSTWFSIGLLSLDQPAKAKPGKPLVLKGTARGIAPVAVEARTGTGDWRKVAPVKASKTGAFTVTVRPQGPTQYRLAAPGVRGALVSVKVR